MKEATPDLNGGALPVAVSCEAMPTLDERGDASIGRLCALPDECLAAGVSLPARAWAVAGVVAD